MPCQGPSLQEEELHRKYLEKLKDPAFLEVEAIKMAKANYEWEHFHKKKYEDKCKIEKELYYEKRNSKLSNEINKGDLESIAFNSFMTVFLCKAMELIESNNLMDYTYHDMEWWYKEHKYRDVNNDQSKIDEKDLIQKLIDISNQYTVK